MKKNIALLYIAGYGRSGSTLMEKILNCHDHIFGSGELSYLPEELLNDKALCACGELLLDCPVWGNVVRKVLDEIGETPKSLYHLQRAVEASSFWKGLSFLQSTPTTFMKRYARYTQSLYNSIAEFAPPDTQVLVDSSKTTYSSPFKPRLLAQLNFVNLKVIHMVRDVRGVVYSMTSRGLNRDLEKEKTKKIIFAELRTIIGWMYANRQADRLKNLLYDDGYLLLRYEDLMGDVSAALRRLGSFLSVDLDNISAKLQAGSLPAPSHQIACNRMRHETSITLKPDIIWSRELTSLQNGSAKLLARKQLKRYKYL